MNFKTLSYQLPLILFTIISLNIASVTFAQEKTMGEWIFKRSGHPTTHIKKAGGTDEGGLVEKNVGLSEWAAKESKPKEIDEKALVEKNEGLADWAVSDPNPKHIDEKGLAEKNEGLVDWVISDTKSDQVDEGGLVQKNVHSIDWVVSDPKSTQIDTPGVVEDNVDPNDPNAPGSRKIDEGELVEYNLGLVEPVSKPKPKHIDEGGTVEDNADIDSLPNPQGSAGHLAQSSVGHTAVNVQSSLSNVSAVRDSGLSNSLKNASYNPSSTTKGLFNN
jgi:hypothetical protein